MAITRSTSTGWLQDLDAATISRSTSDGWVDMASSSGGGVTIAIDAGSVAATGAVPSAVLPVVLVPGATSLLITAEPPSAQLPVSHAISPPNGALAATTLEPAVVVPQDFAVAPGAADLAVTGEAPTAGIPNSWRLRIYGNNSDPNYTQITEVQLRATVGGADQCSGGTASDSSNAGASYTGDKAFDDLTTTRWATAAGDGQTEEWLQYSLPGSVDVVQYTIDALSSNNAPNRAPRQWWLEEEVDGAWTIRDYQYNQGSWGATENRVFDIGVADFNRCIGGTASASTQSSNAWRVFSGSSDDDPWTSLTVSDPVDEWVEYDFGSGVSHTITKYHVVSRFYWMAVSQAPTAWSLEYYNGSSWQAADTQSGVTWSGADGEEKEFTIASPANAQRWRLHITGTGEGGATVEFGRLRLFTSDSSVLAIAVGAGSLAITGGQPALLAPPGPGSLIATGEAPSVDITMLVPIEGASLTLVTEAPSALATTGASISPDIAVTYITAEQPEVFSFEARRPGAGMLSITGGAPSAVQNKLPGPGVAALAITGYQATLQRLFASTPSPDALAITCEAPSLLESVGAVAKPAAAALAVAGLAPSGSIGVVAMPGAGSAAVTGAGLSLLSYRVANPGSASMSISGNVATTVFGVIAYPPAGGLSLSGSDPIPLASVAIGVPAAAVLAATSQPGTEQQHRPSPAPVPAAIGTQAPSVAVGGLAAAGSTDLTITGEAPVVEIGAVLVITGYPPSIAASTAWGLIASARAHPAVDGLIQCEPAVRGSVAINPGSEGPGVVEYLVAAGNVRPACGANCNVRPAVRAWTTRAK